MRIAIIAVVLYWVLFTIHKGFAPKLARRIKANDYDLKGSNEDAKKAAERERVPLVAAKWALRVTGWVENALLCLLIAWAVYLIGAIMTGGVVLFGYPV